MPAKGWRKDEQESNFDTVLLNEHLSIDNFLFPKATINKICKQALLTTNSNYLLAKDTQTVIQRSSILFINFIYHHAKQIVKSQNRKVVNADDIINALIQVGFNNFIEILNIELDNFNKKKELKKLAKLKAKNSINNIIQDKDLDLDLDSIDDKDDKSKRIKLDLDDTMSDNNDSTLNNINKNDSIDTQNINILEDEEDEEEQANKGENEEDDEEEEDEEEEEEEEEEEDDHEITHKPSQLELEERELEGNTDIKDQNSIVDNKDEEDVEEEGNGDDN